MNGQPTTAPTITERDGRLVVDWPTGRGHTIVAPDLIEGWADQTNRLRSLLGEILSSDWWTDPDCEGDVRTGYIQSATVDAWRKQAGL